MTTALASIRRAAPTPNGEWQPATVKWFDPKRRFGFVCLDESNEQVFLHWRALMASGLTKDVARLLPDLRVNVVVGPSDRPNGKRCAERIRLG